MPEGPELHLAARFITAIGQRTLFGGQVVKSAVSTKNPDVPWSKEVYRVRAHSRGKELKVVVTEGKDEAKGGDSLSILFRFGMSGSFKYTPVSQMPKHAHLQFYTISEPNPMVLSFVDYRRFGRWEVEGEWGADRGPDPIWEYQAFRSNVMENLKLSAFNRPICEAMLNQKFFNGIGNYLRAEILYRCGVRPFDEAREVLSELKPFSKWYETQVKEEEEEEEDVKNIVKQEDVHKNGVKEEDSKESIVKQEDVKEGIVKQEEVVKEEDVKENIVKQEGNKESVKKNKVKPDLLDLCHVLPKEVVNLEGGGKGYNVDPDANEEEYAAFRNWLQCYYQDGMKNMVDHNGRTMWFSGEPGRLKPKDASSRNKIVRKKKMHKREEDKKEAEEQNSELGHDEKNKTKTRRSRAKTDSGVKTKKTPPKKTPPKKTPGKKAVNGQTGRATKRAKGVKGKEEEAATPTLASKIKVKLEEANTVPRRRSARLTRPQ